MMNTTTMSSISVKPRASARFARDTFLLEVPVANVGVGTFATFLTVGAEGPEVVFLAARAGEHVLVGIAPRIVADALEVSALAPVADRRIVRPLRENGESELGARILVVVELEHREGGFDRLD